MACPLPDNTSPAIDTDSHAVEIQVFTILVGVITVLCIVLNTVGVYAFLRMPRTPSNLVYLHLCVTDLIVGIFVTPYSIVILSDKLQVHENAQIYCSIQGIMFEISYTTTLFILTYISVDRLLALYRPLKYKELMSDRALFWINVGTWIIPVIRPFIRYIIGQFESSSCKYTYSNDDYFMVCYNTDYIAFVKGEKSFTSMIDQCIIVVTCQLATFVSSILVVVRLTHRLHIKRTKEQENETKRRQSTIRDRPNSSRQSDKQKPSKEEEEPKKKIHHFHATPDLTTDDISASASNVLSVNQPEEGQGDGYEDSVSYDSTQIQKRKKKRKREAERHAIITMVTVIVFFMITYTPSFFCFIIPGIYKKAKENNHLWIFLLVDYCTFVNSTFLPMVHFSRSHGFKRQLRLLKTKWLGLVRQLTGIQAVEANGKNKAINNTNNLTMRTYAGVKSNTAAA